MTEKNKKQVYLDKLRDYLMDKYYDGAIIKNQYVDDFGQLELEKMENIYQSYIMNKRIEKNVLSGGKIDRVNDNIVDSFSRLEYQDLGRQIEELKSNLRKTASSQRKLKSDKFRQRTLKSMEEILKRTNPKINKNSRAIPIWEDFLSCLKREDFEGLDKILARSRQINILRTHDEDLDLDRQIDKIDQAKRHMGEFFPFNQVDVLKNDKLKEKKIRKAQSDLFLSQQSLDKIYDFYLNTLDGNSREN